MNEIKQRLLEFQYIPTYKEYWLQVEADAQGWTLPRVSYTAVTGTSSPLIDECAAMAAWQSAIILVDDLLDHEEEGFAAGFIRRHAQGEIANLALLMRSVAALLLGHLPDAALLLAQADAHTAVGQYLDAQPGGEDHYWQVVELKSRPYYAAAMGVGAIAAGASRETVAQMVALGNLMGVVAQLRDDLMDAMSDEAGSDWITGNNILLVYGRVAEYPEREKFLYLADEAYVMEDARQEAQEILIECGAVDYAVHLIGEYGQKMYELLDEMTVADRRPLAEVIERITFVPPELVAPIV
jgi:geranylgeranyl pyrophosphate synthase